VILTLISSAIGLGFMEEKQNGGVKMETIGVESIVPADNRLSKEEAKRLNDKDEVLAIQMQNRLLELEGQLEQDAKASVRDSDELYQEQFLFDCYDEMMEAENPNYGN
jgi:hypothetical protein